MTLSVQIHSDADSVVRTITLTKTAAAEARIDIESSAAPGSTQTYQLKDVTANPVSLTIVCNIENFPWGNGRVVVQPSTAAQPSTATITVSHAFLGDGTYVYPLRMGEDGLVSNYLKQANFPPLVPGA